MFETLKNLLYVMEAVSALTASIYIKKWKHTHWKWFAAYLIFVAVADLIGGNLHALNSNIKNNYYFYQCFEIPIEFLFFFWIFYKEFNRYKIKWIPTLCIAIYIACLLGDVFYIKKYRYAYFSFSYTVGNILLLVLILSFFQRLANSDGILKFRQNILFWVSVGLLIFYLGSCPYYGLYNMLVYNYYNTYYLYYTVLIYILNYLMYFAFTISFICGKPN